MDFGKVLSRAWQITWRWKVLWILGFLASLGSGGGGGGNFYSSSAGDMDASQWTGWTPGGEFWTALAGIILALLCLGLFIAIAVWVVSIIARGGLIAGVQQVEDEGATGFLQAWRVGRSRFWRLLGIGFLASLPMIIVGLLLVVAGIWTFFAVGAAVAGAESGFDALGKIAPPAIITAVCFGGLACCGLIILSIILQQIRIYAERAAVLEDLPWIDAFKRGWQVLKANLGPTIILWLIFFAIGLLVAVVVIAGMAALIVPLVVIFANVEPGWWMVAPACLGGLLGMIVFALIGAVVQTFTSATWTLAYRELTAPDDDAPGEPAEGPTEGPADALPEPEPAPAA